MRSETVPRRASAGAVQWHWCPIFVRRCTIGVNAKLSHRESSFNLRFSSDAPRNEFAGGERGDNRGTKCPDPKALLDGIQQRFFICVREFPSMVQTRAAAFSAPQPRLAAPALNPSPVFFLSAAARRSRPWRRSSFGLTRLACAKRVRYTQLSPTARSGKSVGSSPTSTMQKREYGWMTSAARWIGARAGVGACRSASGKHRHARAVAGRPAGGIRVSARAATVSAAAPVIACASTAPCAPSFAVACA